MWLDNVLKRLWFYNSGLFDLKSLPNSNSLDFQKETWTGGILAEWLSGGLRWAGSCLSWVSIAGIGRGSFVAVAKPELLAIGRRWVALWPFPPLCPNTGSCKQGLDFTFDYKIALDFQKSEDSCSITCSHFCAPVTWETVHLPNLHWIYWRGYFAVDIPFDTAVQNE